MELACKWLGGGDCRTAAATSACTSVHLHLIWWPCWSAGNFLLASGDAAARLKAIDFGLAEFFEEDKLPRTDLGLEGTPW